MDSELECVVAAAVVVAVISKRRNKKKRKKRSVWVKPWLKRREERGVFNTLLQEFRLEEGMEYKKFLRMSPETFDELLGLIEDAILKQNTVMRDSISPKVKLAATIRYLSTGASYADLQHMFRIHKSTLSKIIPEVCEAIYSRLKEHYLKVTIYIFHFITFKFYERFV